MSSSSSSSSSRPRSPSAPAATSQYYSYQDIRLVPYTPPRIISDDGPSGLSQPVSYIDADDPSSPPSSPSTLPNVDTYQWESGPSSPRRRSARLRRYSSILSNASSMVNDGDSNSVRDTSEHSRPPSLSRHPRRIIDINIHSNKTFSLQPQNVSESIYSRTDSLGLSQTTPSGSYGRYSSASFGDAFLNPSLPPLSEAIRQSPSSYPAAEISEQEHAFGSFPEPSRLWHRQSSANPAFSREYRRLGQQNRSQTSLPTESPLPASIEIPSILIPEQARGVCEKASSQLSDPLSTASERTNYKLYERSSPVVSNASRPTSMHQRGNRSSLSLSNFINYELLGESTDSESSIADKVPASVSDIDSDANYVLYKDSPVSLGSIVPAKSRCLESECSRESLMVAPLRPVKMRMNDRWKVMNSSSRESLRSLASVSSSLNQEATMSLFTGQGRTYFGKHQTRASSGSSNRSKPGHARLWRKELSTVMSEGEEGADGISRTMPLSSGSARRSSGLFDLINSQPSGRSLILGSGKIPRTMLQSGVECQDRLKRYIIREKSNSSLRLITNHDEDGDGLAELEELHLRHFRPHMSKSLSHSSSQQSLKRINSLRSSLPTWAQVYYSYGEHRSLTYKTSRDSLLSEFGDRLGASLLNQSHGMGRQTEHIQNPRVRAQKNKLRAAPFRQSRKSHRTQSSYQSVQRRSSPKSQRRSFEFHTHAFHSVARMGRRPSSVWSPHLQHDRRVSSYTFWNPPLAIFYGDQGLRSGRNLQFASFFVGFVFPFAWMIAAVLPLPSEPRFEMMEQTQSNGTTLLPLEGATAHTFLAQKSCYQGAKWWRTLNRGMSIVGFAIVAAAIALMVIGIRQQWAR